MSSPSLLSSSSASANKEINESTYVFFGVWRWYLKDVEMSESGSVSRVSAESPSLSSILCLTHSSSWLCLSRICCWREESRSYASRSNGGLGVAEGRAFVDFQLFLDKLPKRRDVDVLAEESGRAGEDEWPGWCAVEEEESKSEPHRRPVLATFFCQRHAAWRAEEASATEASAPSRVGAELIWT